MYDDTPYHLPVMDAVLLLLANHDEERTWRLHEISMGAKRFLDRGHVEPDWDRAVTSTVECLVDGWGLLAWQDPLHLQLTEAGKRAWLALQHRVESQLERV